jgi:hypothetical protein
MPGSQLPINSFHLLMKLSNLAVNLFDFFQLHQDIVAVGFLLFLATGLTGHCTIVATLFL